MATRVARRCEVEALPARLVGTRRKGSVAVVRLMAIASSVSSVHMSSTAASEGTGKGIYGWARNRPQHCGLMVANAAPKVS